MLKTDVAQLLLDKYGKKNPPAVKAGDTVRVHQKIKEGDKERVQIFEGLVIAVKHGRGLDGTFTVRKISAGSIGVERTYPLHSPNVVKVERVKTAEVSRAKLYYMRNRKGKNARFKKEGQSGLLWDEPAAVAEVTAEETTEVEEPVAEVVEEAPSDAAVAAPQGATEEVSAEVIEEAVEAETPAEVEAATEEVVAEVDEDTVPEAASETPEETPEA
jgi:large subunit ribosomal protein L19